MYFSRKHDLKSSKLIIMNITGNNYFDCIYLIVNVQKNSANSANCIQQKSREKNQNVQNVS